MQTCKMSAAVCSVCTISISIKHSLMLSVNLNLRTAGLPTPEYQCLKGSHIIVHIKFGNLLGIRQEGNLKQKDFMTLCYRVLIQTDWK